MRYVSKTSTCTPKVDTVGFSINPDDDAFTNAAIGDYRSILTFNVSTI